MLILGCSNKNIAEEQKELQKFNMPSNETLNIIIPQLLNGITKEPVNASFFVNITRFFNNTEKIIFLNDKTLINNHYNGTYSINDLVLDEGEYWIDIVFINNSLKNGIKRVPRMVVIVNE